MRRFVLAASAALFLTAWSTPAHAAAVHQIHQKGQIDVGLPAEAGELFWEMILDRFTIPLGPAYPNFRRLTGREYWIAGVAHHGWATGRW